MILLPEGKIYLVIEGIIGAGKTELMKSIIARTGWDGFFEPADVVVNPYLDDFYRVLSKAKASEGEPVLMQLYLLLKRFQAQQKVFDVCAGAVQDRSVWADRIFAELGYENGFINERDMQTYRELFQILESKFVIPSCVVYLDVKVQTALQRIEKRGRECERGVGSRYLEQLSERYETWLREMEKITPVYRLPYDDYPLTEENITKVVDNIQIHKEKF